MGTRPKTYFGFCAITAALLAGGCSYTAQSAKIHPPFVPSPHRTVTAALLPEPPEISASPVALAITPVLREQFEFSEDRVAAEALIQQAYLRLQHGKGLYQANDIASARKEFDTAVDLMFAASAQDPGDRQVFGRKLDEMVDVIHRFDLAGLGASEGTQEGKFDQAPLEDILKMTALLLHRRVRRLR